MHKRSSKSKKKNNPSDINLLAAQIVETATGPAEEPSQKDQPEKNPAAVALGRLGGLKGGKARAEKLSPEMRSKIASDAAHSRWKKEKRNG